MTGDPKDLGDALKPISGSPSVPTFSLVVFVAKTPTGYVARIANLEITNATGASPRDALSRIVTSAKTIVRENHASQSIPWIEPALEKTPSEQQFLVPMHL